MDDERPPDRVAGSLNEIWAAVRERGAFTHLLHVPSMWRHYRTIENACKNLDLVDALLVDDEEDWHIDFTGDYYAFGSWLYIQDPDVKVLIALAISDLA